MRELSVDVGSSHTVAAVRAGTGPARVLVVESQPVLPSAVWLSRDGVLVVGRDAERQARLDPRRFEPTPKRRIDEREVLLGGTVLPVAELVAALLRRVAAEARRQLDGPPERIVLTHPAGWGAVRKAVLVDAARRAGLPPGVELVPEPVAAAAHFTGLPGHDVAVGGAVAVYDCGGGTTDAAVVRRADDGWRVLAEAGLPDAGGADVDQLLLEHLRATVAPGSPHWAALDAEPAGRRAAQALADDVRAAKEALSRYAQVDVPLPPPLPDAHVTRAELERLVRPHAERCAGLLAATIARAGCVPAELAGLYLVGGASRMPVMARAATERLGVVPVAVESPETSVALGALVAPVAGAARGAVRAGARAGARAPGPADRAGAPAGAAARLPEAGGPRAGAGSGRRPPLPPSAPTVPAHREDPPPARSPAVPQPVAPQPVMPQPVVPQPVAPRPAGSPPDVRQAAVPTPTVLEPLAGPVADPVRSRRRLLLTVAAALAVLVAAVVAVLLLR